MNQSTNIIGPCVLIFIYIDHYDTSLPSIVDKYLATLLDVQVFSFNGSMHFKIYVKKKLGSFDKITMAFC